MILMLDSYGLKNVRFAEYCQHTLTSTHHHQYKLGENFNDFENKKIIRKEKTFLLFYFFILIIIINIQIYYNLHSI